MQSRSIFDVRNAFAVRFSAWTQLGELKVLPRPSS